MIIAIDGPAASGKGTLGQAAGRCTTACRISTPACSTAPSARALIDIDSSAERRGRRRARGAGARSRPSRRSAPARARDGRGGLRRGRDPGGARGAGRLAARLRAAAGGRGARRARHRHGDLPGCRREDLRDGAAGGARRAAGFASSRGAARTSTLDDVLAEFASATRATRAAARPRSPPRPTRACSIPRNLDIEQAFRAAVGHCRSREAGKRLVVSRTPPGPARKPGSPFAERRALRSE